MSHWTADKANVPAAVHARLLRLSKQMGVTLDTLMVRYATERLLYRLSCSEHANDFVLKGAWLFYVWDLPRRSTRDVDFLAHGDNSVIRIEGVICKVARMQVDLPDGLRFDPETVSSRQLQGDDEYSGVRVRITAFLGTAEIRSQVDVGFGEALVEEPLQVELPALLDYPSPRLQSYSAEAAVAEKLEAMVRFGMRNGRMKDYFDIYILSRARAFEAAGTQDQIAATFSRRKTALPASVPDGLTDEFARGKEKAWQAFLDDADARDAPEAFVNVIRAVRDFAYPLLSAAATSTPLKKRWTPDGGWE